LSITGYSSWRPPPRSRHWPRQHPGVACATCVVRNTHGCALSIRLPIGFDAGSIHDDVQRFISRLLRQAHRQLLPPIIGCVAWHRQFNLEQLRHGREQSLCRSQHQPLHCRQHGYACDSSATVYARGAVVTRTRTIMPTKARLFVHPQGQTSAPNKAALHSCQLPRQYLILIVFSRIRSDHQIHRLREYFSQSIYAIKPKRQLCSYSPSGCPINQDYLEENALAWA
jgi:hypothetical protein